ncbi:armadillo repeat-containing protein 8-like [Condylostylus longicornis]|uniref:armadillo repeat-containing protein 8-like n=1 Tax=Condylostylus longicornis TaxID=2530218 RepID=UPI00244DE1CB|nr:armadillo repeat-containing protein 8-like [Condylostylus longicornis]
MEGATFMTNVDNSAAYLEKLYSNDNLQCQEALISLKNSVIGSNRQKASVISQGIVPRLIALITNEEVPLSIRLDAIIVIGSLAKGTDEHVKKLIEHNVVKILLTIIATQNIDKRVIEFCVSVLKSIFQFPIAPAELLYSNVGTLSHLISLASPDSSVQIQKSVTHILVPHCHPLTYNEQMILCQAGAIPFLARMMSSNLSALQIPALKSLAAMCFTNRAVSDIVCVTSFEGVSLPDILTSLLSRILDPDIQLGAARCLTYIHRSGTLPPSDLRIVYKTLPCLARLCTDEFSEDVRATAAETLAYLVEVDSNLQRLAAISNHLIQSLSALLQTNSTLPRQGAFRCFASLGANDEGIRKQIIETKRLMEKVLEGLGDPCSEVRLAAVRCLHSLSRSVQQLRTTFQDHSVWRPLMTLLQGQPSNELLTVVTSTICNLLLEFSPAKEPMLDSGVVEMLCRLTENTDPALRLNGSWALMNMAFQAEQHVKTKIINSLGTDRILKLLNDSDTRVIMKTLGLLRNLLSKSTHIDDIMREHATDVMQAVNMVLDSPHPAEVKEQALCIIGNIAAGAHNHDYVMEDEKILKRLGEFLMHRDYKLQAGALFAIGNLVQRNDSKGPERYVRLRELGLVNKLEELMEVTSKDTELYQEINKVMNQLQYS